MEHLFLKLNNFQGPFDLLFQLIQKKELNIAELALAKITDQFLEMYEKQRKMSLDEGAEALGYSATLLYLKSRNLLPKEEQIEDDKTLEEDPHFDIIHHLIDYCKFKEAAKLLSLKEEQAKNSFLRGSKTLDEIYNKPLGLEHISLETLAASFQEAIAKASSRKGVIEEEDWKVSDKIKELRRVLILENKIPLTSLFHIEQSKGELIALFLALLELMKLGEIWVVKEKHQINIHKA